MCLAIPRLEGTLEDCSEVDYTEAALRVQRQRLLWHPSNLTIRWQDDKISNVSLMEIRNCQDQTEGLHTPRIEMGGVEHVDLRVGGHCRATHKVWVSYVSN